MRATTGTLVSLVLVTCASGLGGDAGWQVEKSLEGSRPSSHDEGQSPGPTPGQSPYTLSTPTPTSLHTVIRASAIFEAPPRNRAAPPPGGHAAPPANHGGPPANHGAPAGGNIANLIMPKITAPFVPKVTGAPGGIREPANGLGPPPISAFGSAFGEAVGSIVSGLIPEPIQSLASIIGQPFKDRDKAHNQPPPNPRPPPGGPFGGGKNPFNNGGNNPSTPNLGPLNQFGTGHIKCSQQEVGCSFLRESAYQLQNDDDRCLKIATSFDQEGRIKFDPIAQDSDNVIYGITTDGLTASAWCNDIGWALRKIYVSCRRGKQCFGGDSYAARNSAFMVTVGPRDKGPRINISIQRAADMLTIPQSPHLEPPD